MSSGGPALAPMGHHQGKPPIRLSRPVYVIGSRSSARIHLLSNSVSKAHALLVRSHGRTWICDLASRSKVIVNEEETRGMELSDGDLIKIGTFEFKYIAGPGENRPARPAPPAAPLAKLEISGVDYPVMVEQRFTVIGRRSRCDIHFTDDGVSTTHAIIFEMDGKRYIRDLGSRTGTYVNGVSTHQHQLSSHDLIRIGENEMRYEPAEETATAVTEPLPSAPELVVPVPEEIAEAIAPTIEPVIEETLPAIEPELEPVAPAAIAPVDEAPIPMAEEDAPIAIAPDEPESAAIPMIDEPEAVIEEPTIEPVAESVEPVAAEEVEEPALAPLAVDEPISIVEPESETPAALEPMITAETETVEAIDEEPIAVAPPAQVAESSSPIEIDESPISIEGPVVEAPPESVVAEASIEETSSEPIAIEPAIDVIEEAPVADVNGEEPIALEPAEVAEVSEAAAADEIGDLLSGLDLQPESSEAPEELAADSVAGTDAELPLEVSPMDSLAGASVLDAPAVLDLDGQAGESLPEIPSEDDAALPLPAVDELDPALKVPSSVEAELPLPPVVQPTESLEPEPILELPAAEAEVPIESSLPVAPEIVDEAIALETPSEHIVEPLVSIDTKVPEAIDPAITLAPPPAQELAAEPVLPPEAEAPVEVIDRSEPDVQAALEDAADELALDALASPDAPPPAPIADELTDTQFNRAVSEFAGSDAGELVEPIEAPAAPAPVLPESLIEELLSQPEAVATTPIEPTQEPIAPVAETPVDVPQRETPRPVAKAPIDPDVPVIPVSKPPATPWGANQENFLGGVPLPLNKLPPRPAKPAPAPVQDETVKGLIDEIDSVAATAEAFSNASPPPAPPETPVVEKPVATPPRPRRNPPVRPQRKPPNAFVAAAEPDADAPPSKSLVNTGFDGLALSPLRDMDVFSSVSPPAPADAGESTQTDTVTRISPPSLGNRDIQSAAAALAPAEKELESGEADPLAHRPRVTPELPESGEALPTGERRPEVAYAAELTEAETASVRRRYLRRVYLLVAIMVMLLAGSAMAIYNFLGASTTVEGSLRYRNLGALSKLARTDMQKRLLDVLDQEGTRLAARNKLLERPEFSPDFLGDQVEYLKVIERSSFSDSRPDVLVVRATGRDSDAIKARILAILSAQFDLNRLYVDDARRAERDLTMLRDSIARDQRDHDQMNSDIVALRLADETRPTPAQIGDLETQVKVLEEQWNASVAAVKSAEAELEQLKAAAPAGAAGDASSNSNVADDDKLKAMQASLDDLQAKMTASRAAAAQQAGTARHALDAALDNFQQQVKTAQGMLNGNPELTAYVQAAQKLQETTRQHTEDLIRRQESQFARLTELKDHLNDRMEQRRIEVWQGDQKLRELTEQMAILERQYNAAVGGGLQKEADEKKAEIELTNNMIKARRDLLPGDSFYADAIQQLQAIIDSTRKDIEDDRRHTEQLLTALQQSFVSSQSVQNLPQEQKELAAHLQQQLQQINSARSQYNQAVDAGAVDSESQMKTQMATLQAAIESRRNELTQTNLQGQKNQQEQARTTAITAKQEQIAKLKETETQASAAYFARHKELRDSQSRIALSNDNSKKLSDLLERKDNIERQLQAERNQEENKVRAVSMAVEPLQPTESDVVVHQGNDQRLMFTLISSGSILAIFLLMIFWTLHTAAIEAPAVSIQAKDLRPVVMDSEPVDGPSAGPRERKGSDDEEEHEPAIV